MSAISIACAAKNAAANPDCGLVRRGILNNQEVFFMTNERFASLLAHAGPIAVEGVEQYISDLEPYGEHLFSHDLLKKYLLEYAVPQDKCAQLFSALREIEADTQLCELTQILVQDAVRSHNRCTACEFFDPVPKCLSGFAQQSYAFFFAFACIEQGRKALRARGVPEEYDFDIPERMLKKQLRKFADTGDISFDDFSWDIGFYCCQIFLLDRFYFIPYMAGTPEAWRSTETGEVVALWQGGAKIRLDGQLDGVNGVFDPNAVTTIYEETETAITAHPVDRQGLVRLAPVTIARSTWKKALQEGDMLIAMHIPGGEGYTPERVRKSFEMALDFYDRYFPEIQIKGFWSESWLFDPGLKALLPPESRILRVAEQFYRFPTMEGDEMIRAEVYGDPEADPAALPARTTLEKNLKLAWQNGTRFHNTGMFLLREDVTNIR